MTVDVEWQENSGLWELQRGELRARVMPVRHHCTLYVWSVIAVEEDEEPFATLIHYVDLKCGDSISTDEAEALSESKKAAGKVLMRAVPCTTCGGILDVRAQYTNSPGVACPKCKGAGWVTK